MDSIRKYPELPDEPSTMWRRDVVRSRAQNDGERCVPWNRQRPPPLDSMAVEPGSLHGQPAELIPEKICETVDGGGELWALLQSRTGPKSFIYPAIHEDDAEVNKLARLFQHCRTDGVFQRNGQECWEKDAGLCRRTGCKKTMHRPTDLPGVQSQHREYPGHDDSGRGAEFRRMDGPVFQAALGRIARESYPETDNGTPAERPTLESVKRIFEKARHESYLASVYGIPTESTRTESERGGIHGNNRKQELDTKNMQTQSNQTPDHFG